MQLRLIDFFSARVTLKSQVSDNLVVKRSFWDKIKRIIYLVWTPDSYLEENKKVIACFKKYVQTHNVKHSLNLDQMEKRGQPLLLRDIQKINLSVETINKGTLNKIEEKVALMLPAPRQEVPIEPALLEIPPKPKIDLSKIPLRGLSNDGCNCCFNAAIQCLIADPIALDRVKNGGHPNEPKRIAGLRRALNEIIDSYENACRSDRMVVEKNSQTIRLALHELSDTLFSPHSHIQEDASSILMYILDVLLEDKNLIKHTQCYQFDTTALPGIALYPTGETTTQTIRTSMIPLSIDKDKNNQSLNDLIKSFCKRNGDSQEQIGFDGKRYEYPVIENRGFVEAPDVLRFQMNRYVYDPNTGAIGKIKNRIQTPDKMTMTLKDGNKEAYELSSFILHIGDLPNAGHYHAYRMVNGKKYRINDSRVEEISADEWKKNLEQAYYLCFKKVKPLPFPNTSLGG